MHCCPGRGSPCLTHVLPYTDPEPGPALRGAGHHAHVCIGFLCIKEALRSAEPKTFITVGDICGNRRFWVSCGEGFEPQSTLTILLI